MTTMSDVAAAAGVSVMTVSNVLNDRPKVGAETKVRVLEAVERLGYEINLTARGLRSGRTGTVGLIVPRFDHPYFGELAAKLSVALAATGRHLNVEQSNASPENELEALSQARLATYDAVLLSVVGLHHDDVDRLRTSKPLVLLGEQEMPPRFDQLQLDNETGARLATAHLFAGGARRLIMAGGGDEGFPSMSTQRTAGFLRAHQEAGIAVLPDAVVALDRYEPADARAAIAARLRQDPAIDGIFAITDQVAVGVLAGVRDAGLRVPDDVQVVGFDNLAFGEHIDQGLSSIDPNHDWVVERVIDLIDRRIAGEPLPPQHLVSPARLVSRGSTRA